MKSDTLTKILTERNALDKGGITFIEGHNLETYCSYKELYNTGLKVLAFLQSKGMRPGDELVFQIQDNRTFLFIFWACILGGIVPVPLSVGQTDEHKMKLFNVWAVLRSPFLVINRTDHSKLSVFSGLRGLEGPFSQISARILEEEGILSARQEGIVYPAATDDIAFVQFSSGSTGDPKGVVLTHKNIIVNVEAISKASGYCPTDAMLSWMPLTHDMGLIGFHISPLYSGMDQYILSTPSFIRRPVLWMDKASEHKVSILSSPNFGYKYFMKHCDPSETRTWDLSNVRIIYNGAEPIAEDICHDFLDRMAKYGLGSHSMCPVYGLAEASLAVSISAMDEEVIAIKTERKKLNLGDNISEDQGIGGSVCFVNVGQAIQHCSIRITDDESRLLPDSIIGHVQIKGDNVTPGYYNNEAATRQVFAEDGWLKTGDLGFMKSGSLYITGRAKDIIFNNGQHYYPHDIERVAGEIEGIELNKIAVAGLFNEIAQKEEVIAFVFHRGNIGEFISLAKRLKALINLRTGLEIERIIPVTDIPRTTSGKLQRFKLAERFRNGEFKEVELALNGIRDQSSPDRTAGEAYENENEQKLREIWITVLKTDVAGVRDKFFEIGGNSLKAAEMSMILLKTFQVELPLEVLYEKQTIRELAKELKSLRRRIYSPIPVIPRSASYTASSSQKGLYYQWESNKNSISNNVPVAFQLTGIVDRYLLEECIRLLIKRHDSLRMSFHREGEPVIRVSDDIGFDLQYGECSPIEINAALTRAVRPFDLNRGSLIRAILLRTGIGEHIFFIDFHHIITDGLSIYHFTEELFRLYAGDELPVLPAEYKDYASWERASLLSELVKQQEKYWLDLLKGDLPELDMPLDFPRPPVFSTEGAKLTFELDKTTVRKLNRLAKMNHCSLPVLIFTLYQILISKYSGQEDIVIGIPVAGRRHPDLQNMQGMFVNSLAIRSTIGQNETFCHVLERQRLNLSAALNNQDYPFEELVRQLGIKRNVSRNPIFDSMFIYQNMGMPGGGKSGFNPDRCFFDPGMAKFDISMEIFEDKETLQYNIEYCTSLFRKDTILGFAEHFENLINSVLNGSNTRLTDLSVISDAEYDRQIREFNATQASYPKDKTIHQLFEEQARRQPEAIAMEFEGKEITYRQLNDKAARLAAILRGKGIDTDRVVGIFLNRSPGLIISILAILKAGGCYLPLETDLPADRISYLVNNSGCRLILTDEGTATNLTPDRLKDVEILNFDEPGKGGDFEIHNINSPRDLAYIIYTSGTTGKPKGVMIQHRSLVNYIHWAAGAYVKEQRGDFPLFTSISFDLTITSIFTPLLTGNRIVIYRDDARELPVERVFEEDRVDIVKLTPSHLKIIAESKKPAVFSGARIKKLIVGGEQLDTRIAKRICDKFGRQIEIYNEYGPTEATVGCMIHRFRPEGDQWNVPIGIPAANTRIYILDRLMKPVPGGIRGELYISGDGVARGYLFDPVLTGQKFFPDPFTEGRVMYKTGDIARRLSDGTIEYLGRQDQQVKINGHRIELAEIGHQLATYAGIVDALAVVKEDKEGRQHLYAYYLSDKGMKREINESDLRKYLGERIPNYMIPVRFIPITNIPVTKNGKVDLNALPEPVLREAERDSRSLSRIEGILLQIWQEVLCEPGLTVKDNFFEFGGDSIKVVQVASRCLDHGVTVKVKDILIYQTIEQICLYGVTPEERQQYEQGKVKGKMTLTPIGSWFFEKEFANPNYFHQSLLLRLNKRVNLRLLEEAFGRLIGHHDGLRINYDPADKMLFYNDRHAEGGFSIGIFEDSGWEVPGEDLTTICRKIKNSFNIENGILFRAALIKSKDSPELLFLTAHHLAMDGVSWRILLEDLYNIYEGLEKGKIISLPAKTATLMDWEGALREYAGSEESENEKGFWNEMADPSFILPGEPGIVDRTEENIHSVSGNLGRDGTMELLKGTHQASGMDMPVILNTALALTLNRWMGRNSFVIEQEGHGRLLGKVDLSRTLGWFTALYPLKLELDDGPLEDQLRSIKEQMRQVPGQGIGYGVDKYIKNPGVRIPEKISEIRFNYLGQFERELNNGLFTYSSRSHGSESDPGNKMTARLELNAMIMDRQLTLSIRYNRNEFKESTMDWFKDVFLTNLDLIQKRIKGKTGQHSKPADFELDLDQEELDALFR